MLLTDEQRAAVAEPGHVCLVSCPGSGKTRAIVAKLVYCIEAVKGTTRRVACITHTNPAADEVDARLRQTCFGSEDRYYDVATIHGFALQNILRPFHRLLPHLRNGFTILTSDAEAYLDKIQELRQRYDLKQHEVELIEQIQREPDGTPSDRVALSADIKREWCAWLDENAYVTLNEIVYYAGRLVSNFPHIGSALASRFAYILVDEFQDSSPSQVLIFREIHRYGRTIFFCVGDPNQSIYRFAGASPELLTDFALQIGANTNLRLTANFRSSSQICAHAERLCGSNPPMRAAGTHANSPIVPIHQRVATPLEGIIDYFLPAVRAQGIPLGNVAILSSWWVSLFNLARELRRRDIPAIGPGARPYKRSHTIAQLVEAVGAYLESPESAIALAVQRSLMILIANITGTAPYSVFNFKGRIVVCKLLAEAAVARRTSPYAIDWITEATARFSTILLEAEMLSSQGVQVLRESAAEMVVDIQDREGGATLTVEDMSIFARPKHCIQLLTVHKAKGREFEAIAVIEAHDGRFPHFAISRMAPCTERDAQYDESRRVVYVATTRAMRILMFFTDTSHPKNTPSPFLAEMGL
jgi:DNA helicase II / ATP-dependent DNA helicase PcrA